MRQYDIIVAGGGFAGAAAAISAARLGKNVLLFDKANALGGAALGLVKGVLVLFLAIWAARRLGISFETEEVAQTYILQFFAAHTPLSMLSLLQ